MPKLRTTMPISELAGKLTPEQQQQHETTYQSSRGGSYPTPDKPVPGTPQKK